MKVLVIADPLASLNPVFDSSLFIAQEFLKAGHEVVWADEPSISFMGTHVEIEGRRIEPWTGPILPPVTTQVRMMFLDFDLCLIRKDPPFDENYLRLAWLLAPYEKKVACVNRPSLLTRYHEKMLPLDAVAAGFLSDADLVPMLQSRRREDLEIFSRRYPSDTYVVKPWLGYQGHEVKSLSANELKSYSFDGSANQIVQIFAPEVKELGDRRVLFFKGVKVSDFVRMPKPGGFVSNTAQGGSAVKRELNKEEQKIIWKIEKFLQAAQIDFAGADLIGSRLNEINITSPTGLRVCQNIYGENLAEKFVKDFGG